MLPLQFITHFTERYSYLDSARMALEGGCKWIQLRMKDADGQTLKDTALQVQELCRQHEAIFIIDDHVELVKEIHADGVHLGKNDMPIADARQLLEKNISSVALQTHLTTCYNMCVEELTISVAAQFRFTTTKKNLSPVLGLDGYRNIVRQMNENDIHLPVVAIGGITYDDIPSIMATGVHGIALSGTILHADDPIAETRRIIHIND